MEASPSPRDLDARRLRTMLATIVRRFRIAERADLACCGTTVAQAATLEALARRNDMPLGELGRELGISPSTLTRNLDRLVDRGLVQRAPSGGDRRSSRAVLTAAGRAAAAEVDRVEQDFALDILERLPAHDAADIVETLETLVAAIRAATDRCCSDAFAGLAGCCQREQRAAR